MGYDLRILEARFGVRRQKSKKAVLRIMDHIAACGFPVWICPDIPIPSTYDADAIGAIQV